MFQKEVALRIAAAPGSDDYGRLSVICQWRCVCKKLFDVNRSAFTPPPKITSSIVQLVPRLKPEIECTVAALERVTAAAFGQRRKMLRNAVQTVPAPLALPPPVWEEVFAAAGVDGRARGETLDVATFARLSDAAGKALDAAGVPRRTPRSAR